MAFIEYSLFPVTSMFRHFLEVPDDIWSSLKTDDKRRDFLLRTFEGQGLFRLKYEEVSQDEAEQVISRICQTPPREWRKSSSGSLN